jgi:NADP-dependent 3-hydroxy acid dehydrogenase YdfG
VTRQSWPAGSGRGEPSTPTALITGGGRGLGAAIARELAPTHKILLAGRNDRTLRRTAAYIGGATTLAVDITDYAALEAAVESLGSLDVLIHNAGLAIRASVADATIDMWKASLEVNVIAAAHLTRLLLPQLRRACGHIVFINSGAGLSVHPNWGVYGASKFALRAFADAVRLEEPALRVTSIHPGPINTDMQRAVAAANDVPYEPQEHLDPASVAGIVREVVLAPPDAHLTEVVVRPWTPEKRGRQ